MGVLLQVVIGVVVLHVAPVRAVFGVIDGFFIELLSFTNEGVELLFGWLMNIATGNVENLAFTHGGPIFAVTILPSIGIQIGGIGALAPNKRPELARLGWLALLGGTLSCLLMAWVAAMLT